MRVALRCGLGFSCRCRFVYAGLLCRFWGLCGKTDALCHRERGKARRARVAQKTRGTRAGHEGPALAALGKSGQE